jgi:5-formyltetrahydrofolate cyclo-ligase
MQIDLNTSKKALRREMKQKRQMLDLAQRISASQMIASHLNELVPIQKARTIMGYAAIQNEADMIPFLEAQQQLGKTILLPRVQADQLVAVEWQGWEKTGVSPFGIREPLGEVYPLADIDVVLVPGLAFDGRGYRLGYGRGFYDRFLPELRPDAFKCGICYEFQVVDSVLPHEADIPMHWIVTQQSELVINWDFF